MKRYLQENSFRLFVALAIGCALAAGLIDPSVAVAGIMLDTAPVDIKELHAATQKALEKIHGQVKEIGEQAMAEAKKAGDMSAEVKPKVDELLVKQGELQARLLDVEQKMARPQGAGQERAKSVGEQFVEMVALKAFRDNQGRGSVNMRVKSIINAAITSLGGSAGESVAPDFRPEIDQLPRRTMRVRDLMVPSRTNGNAVTYVREVSRTLNAATVSETVRKPESTLVLEAITQPVVTIAHFMKAAKQILDDSPQLQALIDMELRYGLDLVEETQLLKGSGTGNNLEGIYTVATAYSAPIAIPGTPNPRIDILRLAMLQVQLAEYPPTGIVLHPSDWAAIELTKDGADGRYVIGDPQGTIQPRLWGLPVVPTQAMTVDTFLVGAFRPFSVIYDREDANVVVATENEADFVENLITVRAEERLASAIKRTAAFVKGDITP